MGVHQRFVDPRINQAGFVVQLEQRQFAALAVDDSEVADDAGQQLRLTRVGQRFNLPLGKTTHFECHFVKQMARQVEPNCCFLKRQAFLHPPRHSLDQSGLLRAGAMIVLATQVEQAALIGIGHCCRTKIKRAVYRRDQGGAVKLNRIKGSGLDQGFHRAFVDAAAVHPQAKIKQALEGSHVARRGTCATPLTRRNDCVNRLFASAFDGRQTVADHRVRDRLETVHATVHIGCLKAQPHLDRVFKQNLQFVGIVHFHRHVGAEKFGRVMHLQPAGVIGQQRVRRSVRLVEAVACKLFHEVEHLIGLGFVDVVFSRTGAENVTVLGHLLGLFLAHGPAQHVGATERVAAQYLCGLHHLLLVDHDAVGL